MKKTISALLLLAASVFAQGPGTPPDPTKIVARLTTLLSLTSAQQTQAIAIFTTEETALTAVQTQIKTARTSLNTAVQANNTTQIATLSTQLGTLDGQAILAQSTAQAAFYSILTADQQTKYNSLHGMGIGGGGRGPGAGFRGMR